MSAGGLGIPGFMWSKIRAASNEDAKKGMLKLRIGMGWSKSLHFHTGQAPVLQYNRQLMMAILHDRIPIAKIVNATVIPLEQAPQGYQDFDKGAAKKFVLDPNGLIRRRLNREVHRRRRPCKAQGLYFLLIGVTVSSRSPHCAAAPLRSR